MLTGLHLRNFKGWADTGRVRLAPLTVLFGRNSSGKSSLLQALLLMKQTAESLDTRQVLDLGGSNAYVDLGTYADVVRGHDRSRNIGFALEWEPSGTPGSSPAENSGSIRFFCEIGEDSSPSEGADVIDTLAMGYDFGAEPRQSVRVLREAGGYVVVREEPEGKSETGRGVAGPQKCFLFPRAVFRHLSQKMVAELPLAFAEAVGSISYVGPMRQRPARTYPWQGTAPGNVGTGGEHAVAGLLADRVRNRGAVSPLERWTAEALRRMRVIDDLTVEEIAPGSDLYRVRVTVAGAPTPVSLTDVGYGISQVLPVIVQLGLSAPDSTVILEQPEIHLHPAAQSELGDVLVSAVRDNGVQLLVETHSEHLLRRLQRRIAEEKLRADDVALYLVETENGASVISELTVDAYGNITNWPVNFFGDEMADLLAMTDAAARRETGTA